MKTQEITVFRDNTLLEVTKSKHSHWLGLIPTWLDYFQGEEIASVPVEGRCHEDTGKLGVCKPREAGSRSFPQVLRRNQPQPHLDLQLLPPKLGETRDQSSAVEATVCGILLQQPQC